MNEDFGSKHLIGLLWLFGLIFILLFILLLVRKFIKEEKLKNYDLAVIRYGAYFMWLLEFIKTIFIFQDTNSYGELGWYHAYSLPFHICSMALYTFLIIGLNKSEKLTNFLKPFSYATMLLVTMIILIIPASSSILGDQVNWIPSYDNILPYQSFLYHGSLVFIPLYMIFSGFYKPKYIDILYANITLIITAGIAFGLNKILKVTDFMMLEFGNGNPFKSMISTNYPLYLAILAGIAIGGTTILLLITIVIRKIFVRKSN